MHPSLTYDNIVLELVENYKVKLIKYSKKQISNFKNLKKEILNAEIYKEESLSNIKLYNINLQKFFIIYYDENTKNNETIRIYGVDNSLKLLSSEKISQFFIDSTCRCLPQNMKADNALVLLMVINLN